MKKLFVIAVVLLINLGVNVMAGVEPGCFVKTGEKVYFGQKVIRGLFVVKITSDDGTVVKVPNQKVESYMDGSRLFELKPVVNESYDTIGLTLMQFVTSRNGLKLFTFETQRIDQSTKEFYVFDDERLYLKIEEKNAADALAFFGIKSM